jgi:hypothetical protein
LTTSCSTKHYINTRADFTAKEPSKETVLWLKDNQKKVPAYIAEDLKICKFNAVTMNKLNDTETTTKTTINTAWTKVVSAVSNTGTWIYDKVAWLFSFVV